MNIKRMLIFQWIYILFFSFFVSSCGAYSFLHKRVNKKIKTFSIENCISVIELGPPSLANDFSTKFTSRLTSDAQLVHVKGGADVSFSITITKYEFVSSAPSESESKNIGSVDRLNVEIEVSYYDKSSPKNNFEKKKFFQFADASPDADIESEESDLVDKVFEKLIDDLKNASVCKW